MKEKDDALDFFIGLILLGAGLFMLSKRVVVHSGWYGWRIGNFDLSTGTVTITLESSNELYTQTLKSLMGDMVTTKAGLLKIFANYAEDKEEME